MCNACLLGTKVNPQLFGTLFRDMVIFPITLIQLEHLSVMAAYVVLYIRLVNMVLKTAYAREIPGRVKGNRQYSRSFVYYRKLACSTVSLTGDRGRGDDSKQYRYYKSTYSTVQGFFFFTSPHTPSENCSEPPCNPAQLSTANQRIRRGPAAVY